MQLKKSLVSLMNGGLNDEDVFLIYNFNKEVFMAVKHLDDVSKTVKSMTWFFRAM